MPETPDFETIAHAIAMSVPGVHSAPFILHRTHIAEQLRLIWNARGAADLAKIENLARALRGINIAGDAAKILGPAIRELDR